MTPPARVRYEEMGRIARSVFIYRTPVCPGPTAPSMPHAGRTTKQPGSRRNPAGRSILGGGGGNRTRVRKVFRREHYRLIRPILLLSRARRSGRRDLCAPALRHLVFGPRAGLRTSLRLYGALAQPPQAGSGKASLPN